jgi:molybdopterin-containing oxidoreductase family iron-sulfur binding subunit
MSAHDQCPSTTGKDPSKAKPKHSARAAHHLVGVSGRSYWRSPDDLADTPEFREKLEREFPSGASELLEGSRRSFMKVMGAGLALAGAVTLPGCRRPAHNILPYAAKVPEEVIPGKPVYYATSLPLPGGGAEGVIVESHEGRPTKVEGNPLHPINRGKSSVWSQSSVLDMYDPDRLTDPVFTEESELPTSWDAFAEWSKKHFAPYDQARGEGVAILVDRKTSPTLDAVKARVLKRWPNAVWASYDALQSDESVRGSAMAFGRPMRELWSLEKAKVIVSLDRDFLHMEAQSLPMARGFAAGRRADATTDTMNRLYVVESDFTITGGKADHRVAMAPSVIPAFAVALAKAVLAQNGVKGSAGLAGALNGVSIPQGVSLDQKFIDAVAADLAANPGASAILVGPTQPAAVHALAHALNEALGNAGATVGYLPMGEDEASSSVQAITDLCKAINDGKVTTLLCLNVNPVYNAPAELDFAATYKKVATRIALSVDWNETVEASNWRLNGAHYLEAWGDTESIDGTIAPIQPLIAPLYAGKSDIEVLAIVLGERVTDGYEIVRAVWRQKMGDANFDKAWRRALHDGVLANTTLEPGKGGGAGDRVAQSVASMSLASGPSDSAIDVVFGVGYLADGRFANNTWLQELPHPVSKIVWDNVAYVSPATARRLGLHQQVETEKKQGAAMATLTIGARSVNIAAWALPGLPDNVAIVPMGYGRRVCGRVGIGTGFDAFQVRGAASRRLATGAKLGPATSGDRSYHIASTQTHGSMEGRAIVREADLQRWAKKGGERIKRTDPYGNVLELNPAEQMGEMAHSPANKSIYENPYNRSNADPDPRNLDAAGKPPKYATGPQWAMTIDLSTCIGCATCTIACQSENNIPAVGKMEVSKYREMHWIRIDRYFTGEHDDHAESIAFQPVACVHCENAPCEVVCPVNATVHGPEGLNYMTYNRCIGTRYCANNCPYKVRRFNFFDFGVAKFNGDYLGKEQMQKIGVHPKNVNLIPPRLRDRLDEISKMGMNPDVTVRSRGVMEKCSYCVQRINEARIEVKLKNLPGIPDGMFQTACQQACPTDAIIFGDKLDTATAYEGGRTGSRVHASIQSNRAYALLGFLNTRPRTSHLMALRNPNPALVSAERKHYWDEDFMHHEHGEEGHGHDGHEHAQNGSRRSYLKKGTKLSLTVLEGVSGVLA